MTDFAEFDIKTFSDFTEGISEIEKDELMLFRGQANDDKLLPKIARLDPLTDLETKERRMLADFRRRSNDFVTAKMETNWDWLSLAQHHGMQTRLLDWTTNPLIALWFACNSEPIKGDYSVVWAFEVTNAMLLNEKILPDPFESDGTKVFKPNIVGRRLATQLGWFTAHAYASNISPARFIPLEKHKQYKTKLTKLKIPKGIRKSLIETLDTCGINSSSVFPDLDGLCNHINWKYI